MDVPIKVIKNFISSEETDVLIEYIDFLEETKLDSFTSYQAGKRLALQFGIDASPYHSSHLDLDLFEDKKELVTSYFKKVVNITKKKFDLAQDIYVCSFWVAKQYNGATIDEHEDTDSGYNSHLEYSGIIYLNTMIDGGDLHFSELDYIYKPEAGDLVLFPSQGTGYHEVREIFETRYTLPIWMTKDKTFSL
jgi:hypothetical protein